MKFPLSLLLTLAIPSLLPAATETHTFPLAGEWRFQLDPDNKGLEEKWHSKTLTDTIALPGTTDEARKGIFKDERAVDRLSRVWYWKGPAWYQKVVDLPESWSGKNVKLLLERTKDTHVWMNGELCGYHNTLSAPQYYDLTDIRSRVSHASAHALRPAWTGDLAACGENLSLISETVP